MGLGEGRAQDGRISCRGLYVVYKIQVPINPKWILTIWHGPCLISQQVEGSCYPLIRKRPAVSLIAEIVVTSLLDSSWQASIVYRARAPVSGSGVNLHVLITQGEF